MELLEARLTPSLQTLTVSIGSVGDTDGTGRNFYAAVQINGETQDNRDQAQLGASLFVNWAFDAQVENTAGPVPVTILLLDRTADDPLLDQVLDINPQPGAEVINLLVDPLTGAWSGDLQSPSTSSQGDGADGPIGNLSFNVSIPVPHTVESTFVNLSGGALLRQSMSVSAGLLVTPPPERIEAGATATWASADGGVEDLLGGAAGQVTYRLEGSPITTTLTWNNPEGSNVFGDHNDTYDATASDSGFATTITTFDPHALSAAVTYSLVMIDSDGDGVPDDWETNGVPVGPGLPNLKLPGAVVGHHDVYVEVDSMTGFAPRPLPGIIDVKDVSTGPIVITTSGPHGLSTGTHVTISGVTGDTAINSDFTVTRLSSTQFRLEGTTGKDIPSSGSNAKWSLTDITTAEHANSGLKLATGTDLDLVVNAFLNAPVQNKVGPDGVYLHIENDTADASGNPALDGQMTPINWLTLDSQGNVLWPTEFDADKKNQSATIPGGLGSPADRANYSPDVSAMQAAKGLVYRYCIFAKSQDGGAGIRTGVGNLPGPDFMVTLGTPGAATVENQAGIFMHELGHTLGLGHGGEVPPLVGSLTNGSDPGTVVVTGLADTSQLFAGLSVRAADLGGGGATIARVDTPRQITLIGSLTAPGQATLYFSDGTNFKPNYQSVMNYEWDRPWPVGLVPGGIRPGEAAFNASWKLDYSTDLYNNLDESHLDDAAGIGGKMDLTEGIIPTVPTPGGSATDWAAFVSETGPVAWGDVPGTREDINGDGKIGTAPEQPVLFSFKDWPNLVYGFRGSRDYSFGAQTVDEPPPPVIPVLSYQAAPGTPNDLTLRLDGADLELYDNNAHAVVASRALSQTRLVQVFGADGTDNSLTVDFSFGGFFSLPEGISFNGGAGSGVTNRLIVSGGGAVVYTPDGGSGGGPDSGSLVVGGSSAITFSGLEYVRPVAPRVTGARLSAAAISENDDAVTLTGEFIDPGSLSSHTVNADWGDGVTDTPVSLPAGARSFSLTHRYLDDNPTGTPFDVNTVRVTVTDDDALTGSATTPITVNNVAPKLANVGITAQVDEGGTVTLTGDIVDPGTLDTFTLLVDWGEGAPQAYHYAAGTTHFSETHQYPDDNPTATPQDSYSVGLTLTDDDTGKDTASVATLVKNVAPVLTGLQSSSPSSSLAREGERVTISGSFADVGTRDTHTVTVDWGDGTVRSAQVAEAGGSGTFVDQHSFTSGGIFTVLVTVRDDDKGEVSQTRAVFITGVGVHKVGGHTSLQVVGTNKDDSVSIEQLGNGQTRVHADFLPEKMRAFPLAGLDLIQVVLLGGNDRATVAGNVKLPVVIDGGDGDDQLNAGNAGSVVIGGRGNDSLLGGTGRDVLIGGAGSDRLNSNGLDDVLIGGGTAYDSGADDDKLANDLALLKLLEEWGSGRSYAERVANLRSGAGPVLAGTGLALRQGATVFDDLEADTLVGGAGLDWFFFDPTRDSLAGRHAGEVTG